MARRTEPVQADRSYTMLQLCEAAGVNPTVVRAAVRTGLKFTKVARGRQYTGKAWIEWLESKQITYQGRSRGKDQRPAGTVERVLEESLT